MSKDEVEWGGGNPVFRARFLCLSSFLLSFLLGVVLSLKADLVLVFAEFTCGSLFRSQRYCQDITLGRRSGRGVGGPGVVSERKENGGKKGHRPEAVPDGICIYIKGHRPKAVRSRIETVYVD